MEFIRWDLYDTMDWYNKVLYDKNGVLYGNNIPPWSNQINGRRLQKKRTCSYSKGQRCPIWQVVSTGLLLPYKDTLDQRMVFSVKNVCIGICNVVLEPMFMRLRILNHRARKPSCYARSPKIGFERSRRFLWKISYQYSGSFSNKFNIDN